MRSLFRALLVTALISTGASIAAGAETQTAETAQNPRSAGYRYLLSLPAGYASAPAKRWPVLLFLHGSGERGSDLWKVAMHGPPKLLRGDLATPVSAGATPAAPAESPETHARREQSAVMLKEAFIVISPQCPAGGRWDDDALLALLDDVLAKQRGDPQRIYLTGLSMGGYGTWSLGLRHPERFAAIVPICGGGQTIDLVLATPAQVAAIKTLGVRVFHGAKDPTVPLIESQRMVDALKKLGVADLAFTIYPEATHDSWTETYNNPELYAWLLRHTRVNP